MNFLQILKRDLWFYRRSHLAMAMLAAVCCAVLTGAMLVGDSIQHTLLKLGEMRLGKKTKMAMATGDRFFRQEIAEELARKSDSLVIVPVLALNGVLETADGSIRVNNLNIYGIDKDFVQLASPPGSRINPSVPTISISESVASRIDIPEEYLLRFSAPSQLSRDMIFTTDFSTSQAWSVEIESTVSDDAMGRFSLQASQEAPLNVFVPIEWLAEKAGVADKANMLLVGIDKPKASLQELPVALKEAIGLEDLGIQIRRIESEDVLELFTDRIFLDKPIAEAAMEIGDDTVGVFTYFVNEIRCGDKTIPYSTVSAVGSKTGTIFSSDLGANEIIINEWLADELSADAGDTVELIYFQITPTRKLIEQKSSFRVKRVVPMMGSFADPTLMPAYPGLTEADSCTDWDSGIPIDLDRIQPRDEGYWDTYKGTPKAFISLEAGQDIWANRFGILTAVRFQASTHTEQSIEAALREHMDPAQIGFDFDNVRRTAQNAASGSTDFAGLFAGLSMFLIVSAAILLALVFSFYVESRSQHVGLLTAIGWEWLRVFLLFLTEGAAIAIIGCILGAVISAIYTYGLILMLNTTLWTQALAGLKLSFHADLLTLLKGIIVSFLICLLAVQASLFGRIRRPIHQLLTGVFEQHAGKYKRSFVGWLGWLCLFGGIAVGVTDDINQEQVALFFVAGTLCLTGLILITTGLIKWLRYRSSSFVNSIKRLGIKNIPRRIGRSLAVMITLACGVFMVVGVGANYKDVGASAQLRSSGTGGFVLLAQTTLPVVDSIELTNYVPPINADAVVRMRLNQKDDASCLNLNRSQQPTLVGVDPGTLAQRDAFSFQQSVDKKEGQSAWELLNMPPQEQTIPAIGDYATVFWGLGKKLNDTVLYKAENGDTINLKIVGILKDSLLQGRLFISEENFVRYFPSIDGYQQFLIDTDSPDIDRQAKQLMRKYRDYGMEVIPAVQKLAQFHEVENTYLVIFLGLGGLGLILGSAGLGLVLVLNVWDRRGEMAMMQAVGFRKPPLVKMLFFEHGILMLTGLVCGLVPALWAVVPSIMIQTGSFPYVKIALIILAIIISGGVCIRLAIKQALKPDFLETLRNE